MRRWVAGSAIAAVLVAAGFVVAHETGARAAFGQLTVRGRVTGVDGRPVRGVKVWLVH
jgi:protocatechuate 3,4-dioxygenase beta subunit